MHEYLNNSSSMMVLTHEPYRSDSATTTSHLYIFNMFHIY